MGFHVESHTYVNVNYSNFDDSLNLGLLRIFLEFMFAQKDYRHEY